MIVMTPARQPRPNASERDEGGEPHRDIDLNKRAIALMRTLAVIAAFSTRIPSAQRHATNHCRIATREYMAAYPSKQKNHAG